ncbi:MAG: tail fiber domain-containing protein [Candidatus Fonsibacter sp.]
MKLNKKPLTNSLDIINRLEPVEYDQTYNLVDEYTPETPQSHQSGFIAQSFQNIDELKHTVTGGEIGEDGKESLRALIYNALFAYVVGAILDLSQIVKAQQVQIEELQAQLRTSCQ